MIYAVNKTAPRIPPIPQKGLKEPKTGVLELPTQAYSSPKLEPNFGPQCRYGNIDHVPGYASASTYGKKSMPGVGIPWILKFHSQVAEVQHGTCACIADS